MTLDQLGNLGDFLAALATLATLAYLVLQIRQHTSALRASAFHGFTESINRNNRLVASDGELARMVGAISTTAFVDFSRSDRVRLGHFSLSVFRTNESLYYQRNEGAAAEEAWRTQASWMMQILAWPGVKTWWPLNRGLFTEPFRLFVDSELERTKSREAPGSGDWFGESPRGREAGF